MGWGTSSNVITTNLDSGTDSPAAARADLKAALDELTNVIDGKNTANGVAGLDGSSKIANSQLPDTLVSSSGNNLTLDPNTDKVLLEHILNLNPQTVAELDARTDKEAGDVAYASNGDAGSPCLAVYNGTSWLRISLGTAISAT